jgi:hypothetical protein
MDALLILSLFFIGLLVIGLAASIFGEDSRDGFGRDARI